MEKHLVVPDVIQKAPAAVVQVKYSNGVSADLGNELTPTQVKDEPNVHWEADADKFYLLCMTDPDAPSRSEPKFREWEHWLVGNIPGNDVSKGEVLSEYIGSGPPQGTGGLICSINGTVKMNRNAAKRLVLKLLAIDSGGLNPSFKQRGQDLTKRACLADVSGWDVAGLHRYVFLVYEQPKKLEFDEKRKPNTSGDNRGLTSIQKLAKKYNLGEPIAANLFQAQWDDYCPILYKQLSGGKK